MKKDTSNKKNKKRINRELVRKATFVALIAAAAALLIVLVSLLFPVRKFEVEGDTHYEVEDIINASGVRLGDRLYWLNASKAEANLLKECPYLKSATVKRKFPNKICFSVEERVAGWYVQIGEDFYALDYDLIVLRETAREDELFERGMTGLILPELQSAVVGEYPGFASDDEHLMTETLKIVDAIRTHDIKERLTFLDLSNRFEIKMTVDGSYDVNFGDMDGFEDKLNLIINEIAIAEENGCIGGEINVIQPLDHSFNPYYPEGYEPEESLPEE